MRDLKPGNDMTQAAQGQAPASAEEARAATQATDQVLNDFTSAVYSLGIQQGLGFDEILGDMANVLQGKDSAPSHPEFHDGCDPSGGRCFGNGP
jgi:hypothetical protein